MTEIDVKMIGRHTIACALRPFHDHNSSLAHEIIPSDVGELRLVVETVKIDMIHGRFVSFVPMDQRICGTRHRLDDSVSRADRLRQRRLACAEISTQRNYQRWYDCFTELTAPVDHLGLGEIEVTRRGKRRNDVTMSLKAAAEGKFKALIDKIMPLSQAVQAHEWVESRGGLGKIILDPTMA